MGVVVGSHVRSVWSGGLEVSLPILFQDSHWTRTRLELCLVRGNGKSVFSFLARTCQPRTPRRRGGFSLSCAQETRWRPLSSLRDVQCAPKLAWSPDVKIKTLPAALPRLSLGLLMRTKLKCVNASSSRFAQSAANLVLWSAAVGLHRNFCRSRGLDRSTVRSS